MPRHRIASRSIREPLITNSEAVFGTLPWGAMKVTLPELHDLVMRCEMACAWGNQDAHVASDTPEPQCLDRSKEISACKSQLRA